MHTKNKGIGALCKEKTSQTVPESVNDVYDFDQQDASRINYASLQSEKQTAKFRSPLHIRHDSQASRKCMKSKMSPSADVVIEASHSGKTSTPYPVTGHQKTKKKTLVGTPAPWVVLSRLQQNSLATYAVSPIAVEHNSPNDLSRQIDVNSMFDDTAFIMDDSAIIIPKSESDDVGIDWLAGSFDEVPSTSQRVVDDSNGEAVSQDYKTEKHKSDIDSGYPKFDSQCDFISLLAGEDIGTVKENSKISKKQVNFPAIQNVIDSASSENIRSTDSDCEMVLYEPGMLDPKQFNSCDARSIRKRTTKRRHANSDVEPSDESADSDAGVSRDIRSKSSMSGKPNQSVKNSTTLSHKPSQVLRTRSTAVKKDSWKTERNADSVKMSSEKPLCVKKPGDIVADVENADVVKKSKSRQRPTKKQNTESRSRNGKDNVQVPRVEEQAGRPDPVYGVAECEC